MQTESAATRSHRLRAFLFASLLAVCSGTTAAAVDEPFTFESVSTRDDMASFIRRRFPLGTARLDLQRVFVTEGGATLKIKPGAAGTEKYIYDIDLCHYYIWRWNISADYDANSQLRQAFVNGEIVHPDGTPQPVFSTVEAPGKKPAIYRVQRLRPEAYKGERSLGFLVLDRDGNPQTKDDQMLMGAGPSRADPMDMGRMHAYTNVDPWRSIFDSDPADRIVPYRGDCAGADKLYEAQKRLQSQKQ